MDRECGAGRSLRVVLLCHRIAEEAHQPVAELFGNVAAHLRHRCRGEVEIGGDKIAPLLGVEPRRDRGRAYEIAEHDGQITALAGSVGRCRYWCGRFSGGYRRRRGCRTSQLGNGREQFTPMPERNADVLEILIRQMPEYGNVDFVIDKTVRILGHAKLFEPVRNLLHRRPRVDLLATGRAKSLAIPATTL